MECSIRPAALQLNEQRGIARDAILSRAPEAKNSVFGRAFAECFVDRVAEALSDDAWTPFLSWVDATYRRHATSPPARAVFAVAPAAVADVLKKLDAAPDLCDEFRCIAQEIAAITGGAAGELGLGTHDTLEETDVALTGIIGELRSLDPLTADHSQAVSAWCGRIAERMGLPKPDRVKATRGGLVHDVGKTTTPREILVAARSLTDEEWGIMREHVLAGEKMVRHSPLLRAFSSIVRSHHERLDGLGYPDGLDHDRIPITVRIVSVADSFNAMIGVRPYRPAMSPARALEELKRCKGSQFDPNVVDAMIDVVNGVPA